MRTIEYNFLHTRWKIVVQTTYNYQLHVIVTQVRTAPVAYQQFLHLCIHTIHTLTYAVNTAIMTYYATMLLS